MSIYGAMFSGVSGIASQSQAMGMIADNISNVNTIGYKRTRADFSTLVTSASTSSSYSPGGVDSAPKTLVDRQGLLQASASPTDLSVSGNGFFVVNTLSDPTSTTGTFLYTRAGSFNADADGNLRNSGGYYLQGWPIDASGALPTDRSSTTALETVNIRNLSGTATATSSMSLSINLQSSETPKAYAFGDMSAGTVTPDFARSIQIFDSKGGTRSLTFGFVRDSALGANEWAVEIYANPATDVTNANGLLNTAVTSTLAFNTDGTFDLANSTVPTNLGISTWAASLGIAASSIDLDWGTDGLADGMTQFDSASSLISTDVNGAVYGGLSGVEVSDEGVVTALFENGSRTDIYKLPLAIFPNPNGLGSRSGNAYISTTEAGDRSFQEAGLAGAGLFAPSTLESSNVDLAEEFTTMIQTQRAYSASSRIITTADEMLDELIRLAR